MPSNEQVFPATYKTSLPIDKIPHNVSKAVPPTEKQIQQSKEYDRQSLKENLRQIEHHLEQSAKNREISQEALANVDLRLKDVGTSITRLMSMPQTSAVKAKLESAMQIKQAGHEARQTWIREVGKYTAIAKTWQSRFDTFDHKALAELKAEEQDLAAVNNIQSF